VTSNRAPAEWVELFGDPLLASAGLDRLGDRAEVVIIRGQSFRTQGSGRPNNGPAPAPEAEQAAEEVAHAG
jgi:DNA replication protein DnaC